MLLTQVNIVHTEKLSPTKTIEKVLGEEEKTEDALIFWAFEQCSKGAAPFAPNLQALIGYDVDLG